VPSVEGAGRYISRLRRTPRQARSRERLQRILDVADQLLASEGAEALTTTRVAEEAGVSVGSLYQYLPDKGAIIEALAGRYLDEFESLMEQFVASPPSDPVGVLIDGFAQRYRERPGYRALWFGRELTPELREADRRNKRVLADGVQRMLGVNPAAARAGVLAADALLQEAFRGDPAGEPELIQEAKRMLRLYLADVTAS
jgi:AcrR family transcriptional regulator